MLRDLFRNAPQNFLRVFRGRNLVWHVLAIAITAVLVLSDADWQYFEITRSDSLWFSVIVFAAGIGGFILPVLVPLALYFWGQFRTDRALMLTAAATGQAAAIGYLVSVVYKIFTGRTQPEFLTHFGTTDISRAFHFGLFQNGIFWGWPSSHAAVAFAAATCFALLSRSRAAGIVALGCAVFIGFGASIGFHWLSDVLAGAILGILAGTIVAKRFADGISASTT